MIVINDSEEKGNPAFPNYKPDPEKRYDTEFWTYLTAYKLNKAGFEMRSGGGSEVFELTDESVTETFKKLLSPELKKLLA